MISLLVRPRSDAAAHRVRPVLAEAGETLDLVLIDMGGRVQDARAGAVLVERTIAQLVELAPDHQLLAGAGAEAVGDQRDQPGLDAGP